MTRTSKSISGGAGTHRHSGAPRQIGVVGLVVKRGSHRALNLATVLGRWLAQKRVKVLAEPAVADRIAATSLDPREIAARADLIVVLGGDGTLLGIARLLGPRQTPILGINLGGLGFLTEAPMEEAQASVARVLAGDYEVDRRITLEASVMRPDDPEAETFTAVNDVVINKRALGRMMDLEVIADRQPFCTYRADGLIVATPTGSTAYALSAGGPIVFPTLDLMVLAPICPHTLSNRPVVLPDSLEIEVRVKATDHDATLTLDGQQYAQLGALDRVIVRKGSSCVSLVRSPHSYFEIWRNKLRWG